MYTHPDTGLFYKYERGAYFFETDLPGGSCKWIKSGMNSRFIPIEKGKLHWFCFSYSTGTHIGSTYTGYPTKDITMAIIRENKTNADMPLDSVVIGVSYLCHMTIKEFKGE